MTTTTWWKRISSIPGTDDHLKGTKKTAGRAGILSFAPGFFSFFYLIQATHLNKQPKWIIISLVKTDLKKKQTKMHQKTCIAQTSCCVLFNPHHLPRTYHLFPGRNLAHHCAGTARFVEARGHPSTWGGLPADGGGKVTKVWNVSSWYWWLVKNQPLPTILLLMMMMMMMMNINLGFDNLQFWPCPLCPLFPFASGLGPVGFRCCLPG